MQPDRDHQFAIVLAFCTSGAGTPPKSLYVFDAATGHTTAHLLQTLLSDRMVRQANSFTASGAVREDVFSPTGITITMTEYAYSSVFAGGCCPDLHYTVTWTWTNGAYRGSPAVYAEPYPLQSSVTTPRQSARVGDEVTYTVTVTNTSIVDVTSVAVLPNPTYTPCLPPNGCQASQVALAWKRGSPACQTGNSPPVSCTIGTLRPGAVARVAVVMQVVLNLSPLPFAPTVPGRTAAGGFSAGQPTVSITVLS